MREVVDVLLIAILCLELYPSQLKFFARQRGLCNWARVLILVLIFVLIYNS